MASARSRPRKRARADRSTRVTNGQARRARPRPQPRRIEATPGIGSEIPDASLREELIRELEALVNRIRAVHPGYAAAPSASRQLLDLIRENVDKLPGGSALGLVSKIRETVGEDLLDVDTWKGLYYILNSSVQSQGDALRRRMTGEYETDEYGMDREFYDTVRPFFEFVYKKYFRVSITGLEQIPEAGRALLVSNHSGQLPWDGAMIATGVELDHPTHRMVRSLYGTWFPALPFISDLFVKTGQVLGTEDNGTRLLRQDHVVAVFPEGYKGVGKLYKERYRLARFGRGGFVRMALKARAPILPVSVVGAEETYISLGKSDFLAKLVGFPYFPFSPTFPWLGPVGFVPLPTKWYIDIGEPIPTEHYRAGSEDNLVLVSQLSDRVRDCVQEMIYTRLAQRASVFMS